jgi:nucleoside-diphosphate-sugar epimerase
VVDPTPAQHVRALVFGASGYIGSNLLPRLQREGWRVRASSRNIEVLNISPARWLVVPMPPEASSASRAATSRRR